MKKILFFCMFFHAYFFTSAQAQTECGSIFDKNLVQSSNPNRYTRYIQLEQHIQNYLTLNNPEQFGRLVNQNSTIIIPVVVHVLHNGTAIGVGNNISEAQILSQIEVLNEDFRRLNADRINTPGVFNSFASDPNIEFRLACRDPNGNNTTGINRVQTTINSFTIARNSNNSINELATRIKFTAQGGQDAWATDRYLNMWVCSIEPFVNGQLLGYAQFPFDFETSPNTDGVVILNSAFGRVGNLRFQFDLGRTTTHEVGHWLDLFHIWGDDVTGCNGSDDCDDTPNQAGPNQSNCPAFPHISCGNTPNGDMFMNYMDYTLDNCKNIFTHDQTNRMRAIFAQGGPRESFINNYFRINDPNTTPVCTSTIITVNNRMCLPVSWSIIGPASISSSGNSATINRIGDGIATVTATAGGYTDSKNIYIGSPNVNFSVQPMFVGQQFCTNSFGNTVSIEPQNLEGVTGIQWGYSSAQNGIPPTIIQGVGSYYQDFTFGVGGSYQIFANPLNNCGVGSSIQTLDINVSDNCGGGGWFRVSTTPNPAKDDIYVTIDEEKQEVKNLSTTENVQITLYDFNTMQMVRTWRLKNDQKQYKLDARTVKKGMYVIVVTKGKYQQTQKVIVE